MRRLTAREVRSTLGARLRFAVDPRRVTGRVLSELPLAKAARDSVPAQLLPEPARSAWLHRRSLKHPFALPDNQFPDVLPIGRGATARWVTDLVTHHRTTPTQSLWFREACQKLEEHPAIGYNGWTLRSPRDVERVLMDVMLPLIDSVERHGFRTEVSADRGFVVIGADGAVLKAKVATHRFYIARALGLPTFPVRVSVVHEDWLRSVLPDAADRRNPPVDWPERLAAAIARTAAAHRSPSSDEDPPGQFGPKPVPVS